MPISSRLKLATVLLTTLISVSPTAHADDTALTWQKAIVYVPGSNDSTTVDQIPINHKYPALIYLHGCAGILGTLGDAQTWARLLSEQGLVVVIPDSMARRDRQPSCDPKTQQGNLYPPVFAMRLAELSYAVEQIRAAPWYDGEKLFLMGTSEGGLTAARSKLAGFAGIVISSWTCTNTRAPSFDGVFAPSETPVLALDYVNDPWYPQGAASHGSCDTKLAGRANAKFVAIPGQGHATSGSDLARSEVTAFIANLMKK